MIKAEGLLSFCRALYNSSEFLFVFWFSASLDVPRRAVHSVGMNDATFHTRPPADFKGEPGRVAGDEMSLSIEPEGGGAPVLMEFCWCPPCPEGFLMGSPQGEADRDDDETQHRVQLTQGFWLAKHPVSQAQWLAVMGGKNPARFQDSPEHPVEQVTWHDSVKFCETLTQRAKLAIALPTEAQWEYACRAGTQTPFALGGGGGLNAQLANHNGNHPYGGEFEWLFRQRTLPAGCFPPNDWGLHDMHGQLWEWCADGKREFTNQTETDPRGSDKPGVNRVLRGGSWILNGRRCRAASRLGYDPGNRHGNIGLRPAHVPSGQEQGPEANGGRLSARREGGTTDRLR